MTNTVADLDTYAEVLDATGWRVSRHDLISDAYAEAERLNKQETTMASEPWNGLPENPERDSEGHVLRVDGRIDIYRWSATDQWFRDSKDRWASPADLAEDGDEYLGQIITPADLAARVEAERVACAETAEMCAGTGAFSAALAIRALGPTPAFDAAIKAAREDGMEAAVKIAQADERTYQGYVGCNPALVVPRIIAAIRAAKDQPA